MPGYVRKFIRWAFRKKTNVEQQPSQPSPQRPRRPIVLRYVPDQPLPVLTAADDLFESLPPSGSAYGLFSRLLPEIRRLILAEAFGYRTIHIDLTFDHPLVRRSSAPLQGSSSKQSLPHCGIGSALVRDGAQPKHWQWFGCVCHRRAEWTVAEREQNWGILSPTIGLHDDECLEGTMCSCSAELERSSCFIGIMGWLLSCRSAFIEGLEALFLTNTIHISSLDLLLHFPKLVYPRLLQQVNSLELLWGDHNRFLAMHPLTTELWNKPAVEQGDKMLPKLCRAIPEACPKLQKVHISIQFWVMPFEDDHPEHDRLHYFERNVLGPIEGMLRSLGPRVELNATIPSGVWLLLWKMYYVLLGKSFICEMDTPVTGRFQKPLGHAASGGDDAGLSYWINSGWNDKFRFMPAHASEYDRFWGGPLAGF
ncbi:hypothetical protein QQS21_000427 [Conoideocrella luteorostrata]|uniref:Uncharacterized protein n=1 Tax=Conoideocrella luteorostrata TaxID=1105319 RepID=A0AAJ0D1Q6_9HYPO|nr:hypothetical protein QQS21_000427 [Conoideocrella luteorostrata]